MGRVGALQLHGELDDIDEHVVAVLEDEKLDTFDLVSGAVGAGVYGLSRLEHWQDERVLESAVRWLVGRMSGDGAGGGGLFSCPPMMGARVRRFPEGAFDLGMSHGNAGVIALLSRVSNCSVEEIAETALRQLVTWLLSHSAGTAAKPAFPALVGKNGEVDRADYLAWCYGDLGLSFALWAAGLRLKDPELKELAAGLARASAAVRPTPTVTHDTTLCHGALGLAYQFSSWYRATLEPAFLDAARWWLGHTLSLLEAGRGLGGVYASAGRGCDVGRDTLLEGTSGVILGLGSLLRDDLGSWDQMLLIDQ
jgi:lantibiotic modifying enzyme